jgi:erythromycin esterase-like protein
MRLVRSALLCGLTAFFSLCAGTSFALGAGSGASKPAIPDTDAVIRELCGKRVALLGESPLHGFGRALQFKVEVVRRLVDECHYNAFFIESGIYDFLNIQKKLKSGEEVTQSMVAAAIGGLWATREVEPLVPFLLEKAKTGAIVLGGLDDQLGRGTYAQRGMSSDLVEYLQGGEKIECLSILQRHMLWQYSADAPYSPKDKALIVGCLDRIETGISNSPGKDADFRKNDTAMVESLKRSFARDFSEAKSADPNIENSNARDGSMYLNFQWLISRLPTHSKVIVWAATTHVAKDLSGVPGQEHMIPLGSYIRREFKRSSFALGFSAYSGSYGMARQPVRQLSDAPAESLEAQAFANNDSETHYFNLDKIRKSGSIPCRATGSGFKTAKWNEVVDGLVVFRQEHPPEFAKQ